jgi:hypothetical protein
MFESGAVERATSVKIFHKGERIAASRPTIVTTPTLRTTPSAHAAGWASKARNVETSNK